MQQRKDEPGPYQFLRESTSSNEMLASSGFGNPINPVGLIASGFRPSDDACVFPFLVPSNLFAVASLRQLAEIADSVIARHFLRLFGRMAHAYVVRLLPLNTFSLAVLVRRCYLTSISRFQEQYRGQLKKGKFTYARISEGAWRACSVNWQA